MWGPLARQMKGVETTMEPRKCTRVIQRSLLRVPRECAQLRNSPSSRLLTLFSSLFSPAFLWRHLTSSRRLQCTLVDNAGPRSSFASFASFAFALALALAFFLVLVLVHACNFNFNFARCDFDVCTDFFLPFLSTLQVHTRVRFFNRLSVLLVVGYLSFRNALNRAHHRNFAAVPPPVPLKLLTSSRQVDIFFFSFLSFFFFFASRARETKDQLLNSTAIECKYR